MSGTDEAMRAITVVTTVATPIDADQLAGDLIDRRLAACVQIDGPVQSHYEWAGKREVATEFRLTIKSRVGVWKELRARLLSVHPYDTPEILMSQVDDAGEDYLRWIIDQTSS